METTYYQVSKSSQQKTIINRIIVLFVKIGTLINRKGVIHESIERNSYKGKRI